MFFVGGGNQGPRGQGQTWGVNCGEFAWGPFWGAQTLGASRGGRNCLGIASVRKKRNRVNSAHYGDTLSATPMPRANLQLVQSTTFKT